MSLYDNGEVKPEAVADAVTDMKLGPDDPLHDLSEKNSANVALRGSTIPTTSEFSQDTLSVREIKTKSQSLSPVKQEFDDGDLETKVGGDITVKMEPGQPPKLQRSSSAKVVARPPRLFNHLPDSTADAEATFEVMKACTYANKYMGYTEHAMECDCAEEWDSETSQNFACGEDSDCINRATKMECVGDCGCGAECQNQRFQRREYAEVNVIQTEKKGFGLRAQMDLRPNQFIYEYIGEVINEAQFRRRMRQYDEEGIKHFYFMSLSKGEFVDATKRGNLARFCNHSCSPNCYVDKWVVGEKLRMGIFAERKIVAGEELVFNYNVDRYGADPQPCYCGEPNCTGFIGGKTQTERGTKLSNATIEALGIEDADDWDTAVAKKPRKRKTGEDDEEYVDSVQPRSLDEDGVTKVMAALMQCKEKWIAVKLLSRIQRCEDERVRNRVVKMHGYQILKSQLTAWKEDVNVVLQILDILDKFPRLTRNKIIDSNIESTIEPLKICGDERVEQKAAHLLSVWATLEVGYRIPRVKRDPTATSTPQTSNQFERREISHTDTGRSKTRSRSRSRSIEAPRGPAAQTRGAQSHRGGRSHGPRAFRRGPNPLPPGWFAAEASGRTYYYSARGETTWVRPTTAAPQPPPPAKPERRDKALQDIIDGIMNAKDDTTPKEKTLTPNTPQPTRSTSDKREGEQKWRSYPEEKQKRIYENTLFPHVKYVMDKFKSKLPKEDLKRYAKEVAKKLVNSDFKNNRVEDPTRISEKQQKKVKNFCKEYFDKAVQKHRAHEQRKNEKTGQVSEGQKGGLESGSTPVDIVSAPKDDSDAGSEAHVSDDEADESQGIKSSPMDIESGDRLKRKREDVPHTKFTNGTSSPVKRVKSSTPSPSNQTTRCGHNADDDANDTHKAIDINSDVDDSNRIDIPPPPPPPPPPADQSAEASPMDPGAPTEMEDELVDDGDRLNGGRSASGSPFPSESYPGNEKKLDSSYVGIEGQV